ncbi:sporulation protein YunB [Sutcliffiella halmapala]|uniref:sporulation protein YunB n=1 Tax=Sutcliffiella halmapala TaxID=79882 RepID=UPI0009952AEA|nr:sporulation protein YunB [Sutcliffiella halmapala]
MRKIRRTSLLKRGPLPLKYVFLISFVVFNVLTVFSLIIINKNLEPSFKGIAETKARQIATQAINDAISKNMVDSFDVRDLIIVISEGPDHFSYSTNSQIVNRLSSDTTLSVQRYLDYLEEGNLEGLESYKVDPNINFEKSKKQNGIVYNVPLGMATKATLFSNLGPKIPVRFEILGDVISNVETKIIESGINNTIMEFYLNVSVKMNIIIPLIEQPLEIKNSVKIGDHTIHGKVPQFYHGGGSGSGGFAPVLVPENETQKDEEENNN